MLMDALDLVEKELAEIEEKKIVQLKNSKKNEKKDKNLSEIVSKNPVFLGLSPYKYFARCVRQIKAPDLDQTLMVLPFHYVSRMVSILLKVIMIIMNIFFYTLYEYMCACVCVRVCM